MLIKHRHVNVSDDFSNPFTRDIIHYNIMSGNCEKVPNNSYTEEISVQKTQGPKRYPAWRAAYFPARRLKRVVSTRIVKRKISRRGSSIPRLPRV